MPALPLVVALALCPLHQQSKEVEARPIAQDLPTVVSLFDGATLDGWTGDPRYWSVEDGCIVGRSTPELPLARTTYLIHEGGPYADFDLSVEYLIESGNSGIQFRSRRRDGFQVAGYQADLDAGGDWTGGFYEQDGRGVINRRAVRMLANKPNTAYELLGDPEALAKLGGPGEWHTYRVRAEGTRLALWVDGTLTSEYDDREAPAAKAGIFALQLHQGPPMVVRYRNLRLETFEAETPSADPLAAPAGLARWIWNDAEPSQPEVVRFERQVKARGGLQSATLWATCDNGVEISLDDLAFAGGEDWSAPFRVELPPRLLKVLRDGKQHRLRAECWNSGGPAGFIARLELTYEDGSVDAIETDRWWRTDGELAIELGFFGAEPWGLASDTSSGVPDLPLAASKLQLAPGFEATEILRVPRTFGSWVAATVDAQGRLICAAENGPGIYRVTIGEDGAAATVEQLDIDVSAAQGLLAHGSELYIVKNAWPPDSNGLYRARDAEGDGRYEQLELLTKLDGGGEHGPHAVRLAPDGQHLEIIAGNATAMPAGVERFCMPTNWGEDQLLPSLPDTFSHGNQMHLHGGWLGRCDLDGGAWEILASGMRNSYSFAYDGRGERFAYDADMEWDMGAPWYRAPRICHLVPGAEFGWRRGSGKIADLDPDNFGPVCETGPSSPVGVLHGVGGGFHGDYQNYLFAGDWTRGAIHAIELEPSGGTFTGRVLPFVAGTPFPITDMAWLPDGSMAVLTGGRGRRSAVYRIRSVVVPEAPTGPAGVAASGAPEPGTPVARKRADLEARLALELDPDVASWAPRAVEDGDAVARLALARVGGVELQAPLLRSITASSEPLDRAALRTIELSLARWGAAPDDVSTALRSRLEAELERVTDADEVKLVELLTFLGSERVPAFAVPRMETATTQERVIDLAMALRRAETGWTNELARRALDLLHRDTRGFRGGRSVEGYVQRIRDELSARVAPVLEGDYTPPPEPPRVQRRIESPMFVQEWTLKSLAGALPGVDTATDRAKGALAFERAGCFVCHRVGEEGGGTGPDLTDSGTRFTARDLLLTILEPSRDISDPYRDTEVWTTDGEVFVGRLTDRDDEWITLQLPSREPGGADGEVVNVAAEDVRVVRPSPISTMPTGTVDSLTSDEIVELLAWLLEAR